MSNVKSDKSRREFVKSCARSVTAAMLGILGGGLLLRKHDKNWEELCINASLCDGCRVFSDCSLPPAKAVRKTTNL